MSHAALQPGAHNGAQRGEGRNLVVADAPFSCVEQRFCGNSCKNEQYELQLSLETWHGHGTGVLPQLSGSWLSRQRKKATKPCYPIASQSLPPFALGVEVAKHITCIPENQYYRITILPEQRVTFVMVLDWDTWGKPQRFKVAITRSKTKKVAEFPPSITATLDYSQRHCRLNTTYWKIIERPLS